MVSKTAAEELYAESPEPVRSKEVPGERVAETGKSGFMSGTHLLVSIFSCFPHLYPLHIQIEVTAIL